MQTPPFSKRKSLLTAVIRKNGFRRSAHSLFAIERYLQPPGSLEFFQFVLNGLFLPLRTECFEAFGAQGSFHCFHRSHPQLPFAHLIAAAAAAAVAATTSLSHASSNSSYCGSSRRGCPFGELQHLVEPTGRPLRPR